MYEVLVCLDFALSCVKWLFSQVLSDIKIRLNLFYKMQLNQLELRI